MSTMLRSAIVAAAAFVLFCVNTVFWGVPLYAVAAFKLVSRTERMRRRCDAMLLKIGRRWIDVDLWLLAVSQNIRWDIEGNDDIDPQGSYLVVSNHQSWVDIIVLLQALHRRAPFPRFFAKRELVWVPIVGLALVALNFPLMKRYSAEQLRQQPKLRGEDLETARRACEKFRETPVAIINFAEGTRLRAEKHRDQNSPFAHLLKPKSGGVALTLAALGPDLDGVLDVTIVYPSGQATFPRLFAGQIDEVIVRVQKLHAPARFSRAVEQLDEAVRGEVREWLWEVWKRKDALIEDLRSRSR